MSSRSMSGESSSVRDISIIDNHFPNTFNDMTFTFDVGGNEGNMQRNSQTFEQDRKSTRSAYEYYRLTDRLTGLLLEILADLKI